MNKFLALAILAVLAAFAHAAVHELRPTTDPNVWLATLNNLNPGDEVIFYGGSGVFDQGTSKLLLNLVGTQDRPIVLRGATNETRPTIKRFDRQQNTVNIVSTSQYFMIDNINIEGGSRLLVLEAGNGVGVSHAVFQNMKVFDGENGISANMDLGVDQLYTNLTFRGIEVTQTGTGTAECFYLGSQSGLTKTSNSLIENCYCHDTTGTSGSRAGIQIKTGSYNNIIRNNVIRRVVGPCILTYDDYDQGANIIEGNYCDTASADNGIQVTAGAIIRNNIVVNVNNDGIAITSNSVQQSKLPRNVKVYHNTVVSAAAGCIGVTGTEGHTIANNAFLDCGSAVAGTTSVAGFWFKNAAASAPNGQTAETIIAGAAATELTNPSSFDFYPKSTSVLNAAASTTYATPLDFNGTPRSSSTPTIGAYEYTTATNPGWTVADGFKTYSGPPSNGGVVGGAPAGSDAGAAPSGTVSAPSGGGVSPPSGGGDSVAAPSGSNKVPTSDTGVISTPSDAPSVASVSFYLVAVCILVGFATMF